MKLICILLAYSCTSLAYKQSYCYPDKDTLKVIVEADTVEDGMVKAGRVCFQALTHGRYPGEEAGLNIIDKCSNPIKCN